MRTEILSINANVFASIMSIASDDPHSGVLGNVHINGGKLEACDGCALAAFPIADCGRDILLPKSADLIKAAKQKKAEAVVFQDDGSVSVTALHDKVLYMHTESAKLDSGVVFPDLASVVAKTDGYFNVTDRVERIGVGPNIIKSLKPFLASCMEWSFGEKSTDPIRVKVPDMPDLTLIIMPYAVL